MKVILQTGLLILLLAISDVLMAAIVLGNTRVIYPSEKKTVNVQLYNQDQQASLVQAWIDDGDIESTPENSHAPFVITPPVLRVSGNQGTIVKIQSFPESMSLAKDRESLFFLNVLDIPPKPDERRDAVNTLQFAVKTRVKLFYRPQNIRMKPDDVIQLITLKRQDGGRHLLIDNPTPYYFTISMIEDSRGQALLSDGVMLAPFSHMTCATQQVTKSRNQVALIYVNDNGSYLTRSFLL